MSADRHTDTQTHRHTDTQTHRHTDTQTHRHTDTQTHRHTDTQTHRHTDTQTHRHTDTQTHRHTHIHIEQLMSYSWCPQQGTFQYKATVTTHESQRQYAHMCAVIVESRPQRKDCRPLSKSQRYGPVSDVDDTNTGDSMISTR